MRLAYFASLLASFVLGWVIRCAFAEHDLDAAKIPVAMSEVATPELGSDDDREWEYVGPRHRAGVSNAEPVVAGLKTVEYLGDDGSRHRIDTLERHSIEVEQLSDENGTIRKLSIIAAGSSLGVVVNFDKSGTARWIESFRVERPSQDYVQMSSEGLILRLDPRGRVEPAGSGLTDDHGKFLRTFER